LWNHVYDKGRLHLIKDSFTVTGYVQKIIAEVDGDLHIQLKLDSQFSDILSKKNYITQNGNLVIEIICLNETVFRPCFNYENAVNVPDLGDYIQVLGPLVFDVRHKLTEIHPVYDIKIITRKFW
jgi:hypothetical protein